jgi:hypothetical protein
LVFPFEAVAEALPVCTRFDALETLSARDRQNRRRPEEGTHHYPGRPANESWLACDNTFPLHLTAFASSGSARRL